MAEEFPEIIEFSRSQKRINEFEKTLLIPHGVGSIDSFFYAVCYAIRYAKVKKNRPIIEPIYNRCDKFQSEIEPKLYEKVLNMKEKLQLKLNYRRFEEQCFELN